MPRKHWSFMMPPEEHGFLRALEDLYLGLLTPVGRALLWCTAASLVMALGGLVRPVVLFVASCAGVFAAALAAGAAFRPKVRLTRLLPPPVSAGDLLTYRVRVENVGRWTARQLLVEDRGLPPDLRKVGEPEIIERLGPGETAEVKVSLLCRMRGVYPLSRLQAASAFPSGIFKWPRRVRTSDRLVVYPSFTRLEAFDVPHGRNYQPGGIAVASQVGESTEFFGTRDYRAGDRTRDLHWPSFARTGRLIVKEFQEEYFVRLAMVLDVESRTAAQDRRLEKSLSLAAGIADALARRDYIIDLFAAGPQVFRFQAGRALAHVEHILEILASLDSGARLDMQALEAALLPEAPRLSAAILLMMDWDEARAGLVQKLKANGVAVRVLSMRPDRPPLGLSPGEAVELR